jgi:hypothetical protein
MHVAVRTPTVVSSPSTPAWVSDWWMPADGPGATADRPTDLDRPELLAPEPAGTLRVVGRSTAPLRPTRS